MFITIIIASLNIFKYYIGGYNPEYNQPFGREAKKILHNLVYKKSYLVESRGVDRYQREIVILKKDNKTLSINQLMLKKGAAWTYTQYQNDQAWLDLQKIAKQQKIGLWKNTRAIAPWNWRENTARKKSSRK